MLAALPQAAASALLAEPAAHPVERELQEHLFACLAPGEETAFYLGEAQAPGHTCPPLHPPP